MADIFRLLSRGTPLAKGATGGANIASHRKPTTTTTAAAAPAPKKRPRDEDDGALVPRELDFFGAAAAAKKKRPKTADADGDLSMDDDSDIGIDGEDTAAPKPEEEAAAPVLEDDDTVRKLLWEHKLKFTILTDPAAATTTTTDGTKKTKKKHAQLLVPPLTSFAQLRSRAHGYALSPRVYANILAQGYSAPTEVQMGALPALMKRGGGGPVDLLTCAPTGSGKTLAYAVPLLDWILATRGARGAARGVRAVVLAPTRELAAQIADEVRKLAAGTGVRVSLMRKGMAGTSAEGEGAGAGIRVKSDVLVSTPLLLLHAVEAEGGRAGFAAVRRLVLDEADVLLDELFRDQTLGIWRALREGAEGDGGLRTSLWSATISSGTEEIARSMILPAAAAALDEPTTTLDEPAPPSPKPEKSEKSKTPTAPAAPAATILRLIVGVKDTSLPTIKQTLLYTATERGKLLALRQLFTTRFTPPALLFVQSIPRAQALHSEIQYDLPGRVAVLHAALPDAARAAAMDRFRRGDVWALITTDVLARGVDFRGVRLVVNYDMPTSAAAYIHRVGRTGRAGRAGGEAVTYYTEADVGYVKAIANVIRVAQGERGSGEGGVGDWLLGVLPKAGRSERREVKRWGVKERAGVGKKEGRISTKSGYERQRMERKRGAVEASRRRVKAAEEGSGGESGGEEEEEEEEFRGIEE